MRCGGMLRSIRSAAHAIAAAVTEMVIAGQWSRRKSRAGMQRCFSFYRPLPMTGGKYTPQRCVFPALLTIQAQQACAYWCCDGHAAGQNA